MLNSAYNDVRKYMSPLQILPALVSPHCVTRNHTKDYCICKLSEISLFLILVQLSFRLERRAGAEEIAKRLHDGKGFGSRISDR